MSTAKKASIAALLAVATAAGASALEFGVDAIAGNLQFPWEDSVPITGTAFPNTNYFWGGSAWLRSPLGDDAAIRISVDRDPVLRNSASALVEFERGIAKISAGPYFGFLNTETTPFSAGISATVRLQWPGVAFVSMRSDGATALSLFGEAAAPQAYTEISAGFYAPHAILSAVVSAKRFNETLASGSLITDSLMRYALEVEIFKKNVPYTLFASAGYEQRSKLFEASGETDSLGAVVIGVETAAKVGPALKLTTGFDTGVYVFGMDELASRGPSSEDLFFRAGLGFSLDLAAIPPRPPKPPKVEKPAEETPAAAEPVEPAETPSDEAPVLEETPQDKESAFGIVAGGSAGYDDFLSLPGMFAILEVIPNLRANVWGGIEYRVAPPFSIGAEIGIGMYPDQEEGASESTILFCAPLRLTAGVKLGGFKAQALGGMAMYGCYLTGVDPMLLFGLEAGGRVSLGLLYVEASYIFGLDPSPTRTFEMLDYNTSFLRFGIGAVYSFK